MDDLKDKLNKAQHREDRAWFLATMPTVIMIVWGFVNGFYYVFYAKTIELGIDGLRLLLAWGLLTVIFLIIGAACNFFKFSAQEDINDFKKAGGR